MDPREELIENWFYACRQEVDGLEVEEFLKNDPWLLTATEGYEIGIHSACRVNRFENVKKMLDFGPSLDFLFFRNDSGRNAFHIACHYFHFDLIQLLFEKMPALMITQDKWGKTPAHICVCSFLNQQLDQEEKKVQWITKMLAPGLFDDEERRTVAHYACEKDLLGIVKLIFERWGVKPFIYKDKMEKTPYQLAKENNQTKTEEYLRPLIEKKEEEKKPPTLPTEPVSPSSRKETQEKAKQTPEQQNQQQFYQLSITIGALNFQRKRDAIQKYLNTLPFRIIFSSILPDEIIVSSTEKNGKERLKQVSKKITIMLEEGVREEEEVVFPPKWTEREEEVVPEGGEEYKMVMESLRFNKIGNPFQRKVTKVVRIQNREIYTNYYWTKKRGEQRGEEWEERWLKHGPQSELRERYDGKTQAFTYNAHLVAKNNERRKQLFLAIVLVGRAGLTEIKKDEWVVVTTEKGMGYPAFRVHFE